MKQTKYILMLSLQLLTQQVVKAQNAQVVAKGGANGIFIFFGEQTWKTSAAYKIERRNANDQNFKQIATVRHPSYLASFVSNYQQAKSANLFFEVISQRKLELIWSKLNKHPDSVNFFAAALPLQLATGSAYFDNTAVKGTPYIYRVSTIGPGSAANLQKVTAAVSFPVRLIYPKAEYKSWSFSPHQLTLNWKARGDINAAYFELSRAENERAGFYPVPSLVFRKTVGDTTSITVIDTSATAGKAYSYKLSALDEFGNIGLTTSAPRITAYDFQRVVLPQNVFISSIDSAADHGVKLNWTLRDANYLRNIRIYRSETENGRYQFYASVPPSVNSYIDRRVEPAKFYYYHLTLAGVSGEESKPTINFPGVYYAKAMGVVPSILSYQALKNGVSINFSANDKETIGYLVFRCTGLKGAMQQISPFIAATGKPILFLDSASVLSGKVTYGYAVKAENTSHVLSAFSDTVYARPLKTVLPAAPLRLSIIATKDGDKLFWQQLRLTDQTIVGYNVFKKAGYKKINKSLISARSNSYIDSASDNKHPFSYYVQSVDAFGNQSSNSAVIHNTVAVTFVKIPAPAGLTGYVTGEGIHLEWLPTNFLSLSAFELYRYRRGESAKLIATIKKEGNLEYTDKTVEAGSLYFYYLIAVSKSGTRSDKGDELSIKMDR
jgi:fibronectin type 3 domain-containing protein